MRERTARAARARRAGAAGWRGRALPLLSVLASLGAGSVAVAAVADVVAPVSNDTRFPDAAPATRSQAIVVITGGQPSLPLGCLSPLLQARDLGAPAVARNARSVLQRPLRLQEERRRVLEDGTLVRYSPARGTFDRISAADTDGNSWPDAVDAAVSGVDDARRLLLDRLGWTPESPEVVLAHVGGGVEGYVVPGSGGRSRPRIVLEATSATTERIRRAAIHQYAHAAATRLRPGLPPAWGEALAVWTVARVTGGPHDETASLFSGRLARMGEGLSDDDLKLAAGNALWLAFLEEGYGPSAVRLTIEELASGAPVRAALDRALRRAAGTPLVEAFREFHLWSVLVGDRSDGRHLSFADRLESPVFARRADGLPALSVRAEPALGTLGAAQVLLRPDEREGGVRVRFEGEISSAWDVDLLLIGPDGRLRRVAIPLSPVGRGELTAPLTEVEEAILLVRHLGADDGQPRRYTWTADIERGYPCEVLSLESAPARNGQGMVVSWETGSERNLLGFNVLRVAGNGAEAVKVNPVWIPAVGDLGETTAYQYLDAGARPGVSYTYRIEAVTLDGLAAHSHAVPAARPTLAR